MDFVREYASALTLIGSTLLAVVYTASFVLQARSELKRIKEVHASEIMPRKDGFERIKEVHTTDIERAKEAHASEMKRIKDSFERIKEVHASEIERAKAEAAKEAIADLRKKYKHLAEYKPLQRATEKSDRDA
jgi:hypothetical protein